MRLWRRSDGVVAELVDDRLLVREGRSRGADDAGTDVVERGLRAVSVASRRRMGWSLPLLKR